MKEKKTVFKLFFVWDFEKEERWHRRAGYWTIPGFPFILLCAVNRASISSAWR